MTEPIPTEPNPSGPAAEPDVTPVPVAHDGHEDVPVLEYDETVPPRPEEDVADAARATPDPAGHGTPDEARLHP
ncbi:hypothetical protein [Cellulomonas triticagri]|uniref:Uncharacterized protein n=1 Tax=Cellulomonas triticagri TaxID=2483352 RepID=A0A3M2JH28_9CELL|nr:hypothetical protein [Cellulomonas triticagri]RMI13347.1 hypothetical protein EBM89_04925 [Cellulomonas triticagri]